MSQAADPHAHHADPHAPPAAAGPDIGTGAAAIALLLGLALTIATVWALLAPHLVHTPAPG